MGEWNDYMIAKMPTNVVYFISDGEYVKIGKTQGMPLGRLKQLQTGNARQLKLLIVAYSKEMDAITLESVLHHRFEKYHVLGEWYEPIVTTLTVSYATDKIEYHAHREQYYGQNIIYLTSDYAEKCFECGMDFGLYERVQETGRKVDEVMREYAKLIEHEYKRVRTLKYIV